MSVLECCLRSTQRKPHAAALRLDQCRARPALQGQTPTSNRSHPTSSLSRSTHHSTCTVLDADIHKGNFQRLPSQVGERCKMQIAHDAQRRLLLRVIHINGILRSNSVHNPVRQGKDWTRDLTRRVPFTIPSLLRRLRLGRVSSGRNRRRRLHGRVASWGTRRNHRIRKRRKCFFSGGGIQNDMAGRLGALSQGIVHRRALDGNRRLPVPWEVGNWGLVEPGTRIDVDSINDLICSLRGITGVHVRGFILARWREQ